MDSVDTTASAVPPFERWLEAARPKAKLWRIIIGIVIAVAVWTAWSLAAVFVYVAIFTGWSDGASAQLSLNELLTGATSGAIMALLLTFLGLWFGVWLALRLMHGQRFWTVVSPEQTIRWRDFSFGVAIIAVYFTLNLVIGFAVGLPPGQRSDLSLVEWVAIAAPICILVFFQASGEELLFRGYITQQLAARFRNPVIWGLFPSLAFGTIHYANGTFPEYSAYYVIVTTLFGLIATVSVWRTGSLSMAMGMHTTNNVGSFLIAGTKDEMNATQLWLWSVDDIIKTAPYDVALLTLMLVFMLSPLAPMPKRQLLARRNETRAAP